MTTTEATITGRIFEIQRFSVHDGPGIRTTVFLKGCPLRCLWCHNPEGTHPGESLAFSSSRCIGCGACFRACPRGAHRIENERHVIDRDRCVVCGSCADECHAGALERVGRDSPIAEILDEVKRDRVFYETSGGGLTISGGEPLFQIDFTEALLRAAKMENLHCCIETCGHAEWTAFERLLGWVDLFLFDVKETDPIRHRQYTGVDNGRILANLRKLHERGAVIRLRCPIVPGYNDRPDHFESIARIALSLPRLDGVELMAYHPLGESKIERFGLDTMQRAEASIPDATEVTRWAELLRSQGVIVLNETN